jgi:hypothetical protein
MGQEDEFLEKKADAKMTKVIGNEGKDVTTLDMKDSSMIVGT